jgi:DNA-binding NtrC family response regulator
MHTELKQFTTRALEKLSSYSWPGNARQLENEIKRLVASVRGKSINEDHLDSSIRNQTGPVSPVQTIRNPVAEPPSSDSLPTAVEALERHMIQAALRLRPSV